MNKTLKNIATYAVMFSVTAFLLWFSLKDLQIPQGKSKFDFIVETWNKADKLLFGLSALLAVLMDWLCLLVI